MPVARAEDEWDEILKTELGVKVDGVEDGVGLWSDAIENALEENSRQYEQELYKGQEMAKRMQSIVDREMSLAKAEGVKVVRGRQGRSPPKSQQK